MENEVKGENKNKVGIVVVIILCVLSIILGGIGGYLYFSMDKDKINDEPKVDNKETIETYEGNKSKYTKVAYKDEYLYSVVEYCKAQSCGYDEDEKDRMLGTSVVIPKITIETETTKKINRDIYDENKGLIDDINKKVMAPEFYGSSAWYESLDKDDIVFIKVLCSFGGLHSGGGATTDYYYYDVKNDKQLTNADVMNHFGITINDLNAALKKEYPDDDDNLLLKEAGYDNITNLDFPVYPKDNNVYVVYFANLGPEGRELEITK